MNYLGLLYPWRLELTMALSIMIAVISLILCIRSYRMLKYLTGGRTWKGRFAKIRERFMRKRRG